jgi:hypothetical protein
MLKGPIPPSVSQINHVVCDDIRQEVGNESSLMGCYGVSMVLTDFPVVLPKLCAS